MGCHFSLQEIFLNQGSNLHLLNWHADSLPLSHLWSPSPLLHTNKTQFFKKTSLVKNFNLSLFLCLPISLPSIFILQTFKMVPLYISPRIVAQVSRWTQYHTFVGSEGQIITLYILLRNLKEIGIYVECKQGSDAIKCVICKRSFWKRDESWVECGHRMMRLRSQGRWTQSKGSRQKERRGPTEEILGSRTERCSKGVRFLTKATEWLMN